MVIIGQVVTQGVINRGTHIISNLVTNVLMNSRKILFNTNTFQLNALQYETLRSSTYQLDNVNGVIKIKVRPILFGLDDFLF